MMSPVLSWRRVVSVFVLLLAVAGVVAARALPGADAQEPPGTATIVVSNIVVTPSNGFTTLGEDSGSMFGIVGVACTGAAPRSGTRIPGQIVTELRTDGTFLRVMRNDGRAISGTVRINCAVEYELTTTGTNAAERLRESASAH
jgi:hypothetical protein